MNTIYQLLFASATANFGPLLEGQPHPTDVNNCVSTIQHKDHQEPYNKVESLGLAEHLVGGLHQETPDCNFNTLRTIHKICTFKFGDFQTPPPPCTLLNNKMTS